MANNGRKKTRTRDIEKVFVLLRSEDAQDRVPSAGVWRTLEAAGRIQSMSFQNNATTQHVVELLLNSFANHLNPQNVNRYVMNSSSPSPFIVATHAMLTLPVFAFAFARKVSSLILFCFQACILQNRGQHSQAKRSGNCRKRVWGYTEVCF